MKSTADKINETNIINENHTAPGKVTLVGAGCGKGLITVLGADALKKAESVVYDDLTDDGLLKLPEFESCRFIYVGKRMGKHSMTQDEINAVLIGEALAGRNTVRLKGGDGFVFGRGGEELAALSEKGIECGIIPGVSSCIAVPESFGIPVTHRNTAQSFTVVTGHTAGNKCESYEALAGLKGTLIFLMAINEISNIAEKLIKNGKSPDTPASVISRGFTDEAERIDGTLCDIGEKARNAKTPGMLVVGKTASPGFLPVQPKHEYSNGKANISGILPGSGALKKEPYENYIDKNGKHGSSGINKETDIKTVLVTGTGDFTERVCRAVSEKITNACGNISRGLPEYGIKCTKCETLKIFPIAGSIPHDYGGYKWAVFTSANGVDIFFDGLKENDIDIRSICGLRFACIGSGTANALKSHGITADFVPDKFTSEAFGRELGKLINAERNTENGETEGINAGSVQDILILRAENGSKLLTEELSKSGIAFNDVHIYRTEHIKPETFTRTFDYIVFGSAEGVRAWFDVKNKDIYKKAVCIGEFTAAEYTGITGDKPLIAENAAAADIARVIKADIERGTVML